MPFYNPTPAASGLLGSAPAELALAVRGSENVVRLRSRKCVVGSAEGCTLRLRTRQVAPRHCLILRGQQRTLLRNWTRGTRLNGLPVYEAELKPGDRLQVGPAEFEVIELGTRGEPAEPYVEVSRPHEPAIPAWQQLDSLYRELDQEKHALAEARQALEAQRAQLTSLEIEHDQFAEAREQSFRQREADLALQAANLADREARVSEERHALELAETRQSQQLAGAIAQFVEQIQAWQATREQPETPHSLRALEEVRSLLAAQPTPDEHARAIAEQHAHSLAALDWAAGQLRQELSRLEAISREIAVSQNQLATDREAWQTQRDAAESQWFEALAGLARGQAIRDQEALAREHQQWHEHDEHLRDRLELEQQVAEANRLRDELHSRQQTLVEQQARLDREARELETRRAAIDADRERWDALQLQVTLAAAEVSSSEELRSLRAALDAQRAELSKLAQSWAAHGELASERDQLAHERGEVTSERNQLAQERGELAGERDQLTQQRGELATQRDQLAHERGEVTGERNQLAQERGELAGERDQLTQQRGELATQRDQLAHERGEVTGERNQLAQERGELLAAQSALLVARDKLADELARHSAQAVALADERSRADVQWREQAAALEVRRVELAQREFNVETAETQGAAQFAAQQKRIDAGTAALADAQQQLHALREALAAEQQALEAERIAWRSERLALSAAQAQTPVLAPSAPRFDQDSAAMEAARAIQAALDAERKQLETAEELLQARQEQLASETRAHAARHEALAEAEATNDAQRAALTAQRVALDERQAQLDQRTQELDTRWAEYSARHTQLQAEQQTLAAQRTELDQSRHDLSAERDELERQRAEVHELRQQVEEQGRNCTQRDQATSAQLQEFDARQAELDHRAESLEAQSREMTRRAEELESRQRELAEREAHCRDEADRLAAQREELARGESQLATRHGEVEAERAELEALRQQLSQRSDELSLRAEEFESRCADIETQAALHRQSEAAASEPSLAEVATLDARRAELESEAQRLELQASRLAEEESRLAAWGESLVSDQARLDEARVNPPCQVELPSQSHGADLDLERARREVQDEAAQLTAERLRLAGERAEFEAEMGERRRELDQLERQLERERRELEEQGQALEPPFEAPACLESEFNAAVADAAFETHRHDEPEAPREFASLAPATCDPLETTPGTESVSDILRRLGRLPVDSGESTPQASAPKPEVAAPVPALPAARAEQATEDHLEEESIDDYMQKLLERARSLQGGSVLSPALEPSKRSARPVEPQVAVEPERPKAPPAPRPRMAAAEKQTGLAALREVANLSAQDALAQHARRSVSTSFIENSLAVVAAFSCAGGIWIIKPLGPEVNLYSALACCAVGLLCLTRAAFLLPRLLASRADRPQVHEEPPAAAAGALRTLDLLKEEARALQSGAVPEVTQPVQVTEEPVVVAEVVADPATD